MPHLRRTSRPLLLLSLPALLLHAPTVFGWRVGAAGNPPRGAVRETVQWKPLEIRLAARGEHPWWSFPTTAVFTHRESGSRLEVEGYWDGGREWVIRFAAPSPGSWTWRTLSRDEGLDGATGRIDVRAPAALEVSHNPNYRGQLQIGAGARCFEYADGTPFFLLADTLWAGNTARCGLGRNRDGPFYQYLADREGKGFTTILIKYLHGFGDISDGAKGDRNEGGWAFLDQDLRRLNPAYFRALDRRLAAIWSHGLVAATPVAWWGKTRRCVFDIQWAQRVSAYCAVRYGAYNAIWSLSGEYQYAFRDCGWTPEQFNELGAVVQAHNPYRHPLSIHPSSRTDWPAPHNCQSSRPYQASGWLDHHWLQTGQSVDRMYNIVARAEENRALTPARPVFCSEACYDAASDPDQAYHTRWQAWTAFLSGCAGFGYGAHGVWQFYDPGDGEGETGKRNGRAAPWREAMQFGGSKALRPVRSLLTEHPWWRLDPHRDWLVVDGGPAGRPTAADLSPPCCAAIPGRLYIVYIPRGNRQRALKLVALKERRYSAGWWDPRVGRMTPIPEGPTGQVEWTVPDRPAPSEEDWVLVLAADEDERP